MLAYATSAVTMDTALQAHVPALLMAMLYLPQPLLISMAIHSLGRTTAI
jgi:hypothetical protein